MNPTPPKFFLDPVAAAILTRYEEVFPITPKVLRDETNRFPNSKGATMTRRIQFAAVAAAFLIGSAALAKDSGEGLVTGDPGLKSAGALAFGPNGILFIGDSQGSALVAIDTGDQSPGPVGGTFQIEGIDGKIAGALGVKPRDLLINDLAVNPISGKAYLSVSRGRGPDAAPVLVRADRSGKVEIVALEKIPFAKVDLANPPDANAKQMGQSLRSDAITDIAYLDGKLYVARLSNEEFSSKFLMIPFPFKKSADEASVEIYHGSHGRLETKSPIRTFVPFAIKGESYLMAAYTCTPIVKVPVAALKPGSHVKGTTIAELGNRNRPLDMITYAKGGKTYLLLANSSRGVMKVETEDAGTLAPITARVPDKQGLTYETIGGLKGVVQLDKLGDNQALILTQAADGAFNLQSIDLP